MVQRRVRAVCAPVRREQGVRLFLGRGRSVKRRSILAWFVFVIVFGPATALIWTQVVPVYRAEAELRVRPIIPVLVFPTEDNGPIPSYASFVNTQISVIKSPTVLQCVLDQQAVQQTKWYSHTARRLVTQLFDDSTPAMERVLTGLSVEARPDSEIIDLYFDDANSKEAKVILDAILEQYIMYAGRKAEHRRDDIYGKLVEQQHALEREIRGQESVLNALRKALGSDDPKELLSAKRLAIEESQERLRELRQSIAISEWDIQQATAGGDNDVNRPADVPSLEHQLARSRKHEQLVADDLKARQAEFGRFFADAQLLEKENRDLARKRELLDAVRDRIDRKDMERNVAGPIEVLTPAYTSSKPFRDRRILYTALALGAGLLASGITVLLGRRRNSSTL